MKTDKRFLELDVLRGSAVVLMVLFHFGFDLAEFGYTSYKTTVDTEWILFRGIILSMFLLAVGMSSYLAYHKGVNKKKLFKNLAKLALVSILISVGSYTAFPHSWIYFGVIHFILIALPVSIVFLHLPRLSLLLGLFIILTYIMGYFHLDYLHQLSMHYLNIPRFTVDVVSFTPWFGLVLIGIFLMHHNLFGLKIKENSLTSKLALLGRHSLLIYLVHQPILFAIFNIVGMMK